MTTRAQLRERIDRRYPHLSSAPLDWAIREVRRLRALDAYVARCHEREYAAMDRAYREWRDGR